VSSEEQAGKTSDALLEQSGWHGCGMKDANIHAARGVAIREFSLKSVNFTRVRHE